MMTPSEELLNAFADHLRANGKAQATIYAYLSDLRAFDEWARGLLNLTEQSVRNWRKHLLENKYSPATINRRLNALAVFAQWAMDSQRLKSTFNPVMNVSGIPAISPLRTLSADEQGMLLRIVEDALTQTNVSPRRFVRVLRDAAIVETLLHTGIRVRECSGLTCEDWDGETLKVRGSVVRVLPLPAASVPALRLYFQNRTGQQARAMFLNDQMANISPHTVQRAVRGFAAQAGLYDVNAHTLRLTFARNLAESGLSLEDVALYLGHTSVEDVTRYLQEAIED